MEQKRINIWSGPRNISTALMYSFAQRNDTIVYDEPLYGYYLENSPAKEYHPGANETMASMECNENKVISMMMGPHPKPVAFFKQMTHHILVDLDRTFMDSCVNVLLTRDPRDMLPSYAKEVAQPSMVDVGYKAHLDLLEHLRSIGQEPPVLDSRRVLENPESVLRQLCERIGIPFDPAMLQWEAGARPEDGSWAKIWYHSVHKSTGFQTYKAKTDPFPEHIKPLLEECLPYYDALLEMAI